MPAKKENKAGRPKPRSNAERAMYRDAVDKARAFHCKSHEINSFTDFKNYMVELMNAVRIGEIDKSAANSNAYMGSLILMSLERMHKYGETKESIAAFLAESGLQIEMSPEEAAILLKETNQNTQVKIIQEVLKRRQDHADAVEVHEVGANKPTGNFEQDAKKLLQMATEFRGIDEIESTAPAVVPTDDSDEIPF